MWTMQQKTKVENMEKLTPTEKRQVRHALKRWKLLALEIQEAYDKFYDTSCFLCKKYRRGYFSIECGSCPILRIWKTDRCFHSNKYIQFTGIDNFAQKIRVMVQSIEEGMER
jgi:ribulose bisphosphate carboxylase small subunit